MKYKFAALIIALFIGLVAQPVGAQPAHSCGDMNGFSVVFATVDNLGIAPKAMPGSEARFNCIAERDPSFNSQRFDASWQAFNYWQILYSQELGATVQPLPAPTG